MPSPRPALTLLDVRRFVEDRCFLTGAGLVGAELEWFVTGDAPHAAVVAATAGPFAGGSSLTFEPGGQVELSSCPGTPTTVCADLTIDSAELQRRLALIGAGLSTAGVDPDRD